MQYVKKQQQQRKNHGTQQRANQGRQEILPASLTAVSALVLCIRLTGTLPASKTQKSTFERRSSGSVHAWSPPPAWLANAIFLMEPSRKPHLDGAAISTTGGSSRFTTLPPVLLFSGSLVCVFSFFPFLYALLLRCMLNTTNPPGLAPSRRWAVKLPHPPTHPAIPAQLDSPLEPSSHLSA